MHNDGKVVPIHKAPATPSPLARLPVVLLQVRDKAAQQLRQGLQDLFDNADDTLFEMADKTRSNTDHGIFFEAMRDLRLKRKNFERGFMDLFCTAFDHLGVAERADLHLVPVVSYKAQPGCSKDDIEKAVALEAMVGKVQRRDGLALGQLTARIAHLLGKRLGDAENPLGPAMLCDFFLQAGRSLGMEIRVKLIILKLFERYVLSDADHLYGEANQLLIATGVLPELKAVPCRRNTVRADRFDEPEPDHSRRKGEEGQEMLADLQQLLLAVRGSVAPTLEPSAQTLPISTRDLLRLLSHLQQYVPEVEDDFDLRIQLEQLLTLISVKSGKSRVIEAADEDVINLIDLLFDCLLDDSTVPSSLKGLIARLQIPMLKVALLDKRFFSCRSHPARRLLNDVVCAAAGWSRRDSYQRDKLFEQIETLAQRLLSDFVDDPEIFSRLLAAFDAFTWDERRLRELLGQPALADAPLFDRALASVIGRLRQLNRVK